MSSAAESSTSDKIQYRVKKITDELEQLPIEHATILALCHQLMEFRGVKHRQEQEENQKQAIEEAKKAADNAATERKFNPFTK